MLHHAVPIFPFSEIEEFQPPSVPDINLPDRWVAASLLQKGIRRGEAVSCNQHHFPAIIASLWLKLGRLQTVRFRLNCLYGLKNGWSADGSE